MGDWLWEDDAYNFCGTGGSTLSTNTWQLASIIIWMRRMRALVYGSSQHRALWLVVGYLSISMMMMNMIEFIDNISHYQLCFLWSLKCFTGREQDCLHEKPFIFLVANSMFTWTMPYPLAVFNEHCSSILYALRVLCGSRFYPDWICHKMSRGRNATFKAERGVKDQLKTAVKS